MVGGLIGKVLIGPLMEDHWGLLAYIVDQLKCMEARPRLIFDESSCCFELSADVRKSELS